LRAGACFGQRLVIRRRFDPLRIRDLPGPVEPVQAVVTQKRAPKSRRFN
jgi:hypothetical protein